MKNNNHGMNIQFIDSDSDDEVAVSSIVIVRDPTTPIILPEDSIILDEEFKAVSDRKRKLGDKAMVNGTSQIYKILFGVYSSEEIMQMGVCEVNSVKMSGRGSIYDMRMGTIEDGKDCDSCGESDKTCTGHFGYIILNVPILHPLKYFRKIIINYLRIFCMNCSSMLITPEQIELKDDLEGVTGIERFELILQHCTSIDYCDECKIIPPVFSHVDGKFFYTRGSVKKKNKVRSLLRTNDIVNIFDNIKPSMIDLLGLDSKMIHPKNLIIRVLPVCPPSARPFVIDGTKTCDDDLSTKYLEIIKQNIKLSPDYSKKKKKEFDRDKSIQFLEFHIKTLMDNSDNKAKHTNGRPLKSIKQRMNGKGNLLRSNLAGKRSDFSGRTVAGPDTTLRLNEVGLPPSIMDNLSIPHTVCKYNKAKLEISINNGESNSVIRDGKILSLDFSMWTKSSKLQHGDRVLRGSLVISDKDIDYIKSIEDRIYKVYWNVVDEVKDKIREENKTIDYILYTRGGELLNPFKLINFTFVKDDKIIRIDNGIKIDSKIVGYKIIEAIPKKKKIFKLKYGDKVEMKYKNGDPILVNRQPTLHLGSMLVFKAKKIVGKTIRIPLSVSSSYNCDFDGDELNLHAPQDIMSVVECQQLCNVGNNMMSCKSNNSLICMVQDALIGSYLMSSKNEDMDKGDFFDVTMKCYNGRSEIVSGLDIDFVLDGIDRYVKVLKSKGKYTGQKYTSRCLWSLALPIDFDYECNTKGMTDEPILKIERGIIYEGSLTKKVLGKGHNGIIQTIHKEYGQEIAMNFVSNVQFITDAWLLTYGFSIGLKDCYSSRDEIVTTVEKCIDEAELTYFTSTDPLTKEIKINNALNKARDVGIKIATNYLTEDNPLRMMIVSGAKGDYVNIAQISGLLGQQNINGQRVIPNLSSGMRTLSQYKFSGNSKIYKYESRGFISGSFMGGLNPREYFFHAMSGREGLVNTSCKTAISGYIQRRMVKVMEDLQVANDMTVRNSTGRIIQFNYGQDNYNPSKLLKLKHGLTPVNIKRLVNRLNRKIEKFPKDGGK